MGRIRAARLNGALRLAGPLLAGGALGLLAQEPDLPLFTADVQLVSLPVTVKDANNAPIADLEREDFTILEDGEPLEITVFERRTDRPLSVALVLDASLSTAIELRYERESAARFLAGLLEGADAQPADRAAVYSFSSDVEALAEFTRDQGALKKGLARVRPETGTSAYDAILLVSKELESREGRRVIIVITDGGDTTSRYQFDDALRAAHDAEAAIYPLIVLPIRSDAGRNRGGEHALVVLARNTGGEAFVQHSAETLDAAFAQVLRNLRTQYLLGYYSPREAAGSKPAFRGIEVRANREGAVVLARNGYVADPPPEEAGARRSESGPVRVRTLPQVGTSPGQRAKRPEPPEPLPERPPRRQARPRIVRPGR